MQNFGISQPGGSTCFGGILGMTEDVSEVLIAAGWEPVWQLVMNRDNTNESGFEDAIVKSISYQGQLKGV